MVTTIEGFQCTCYLWRGIREFEGVEVSNEDPIGISVPSHALFQAGSIGLHAVLSDFCLVS